MTIQLNTDEHIQGTEALEKAVSEKLQHELKHFSSHLTRVEVHLSDQNGQKGGPDDILCKIEARIQGAQPILAEAKNSAKEKALAEAADKLKAALKTTLGKMQTH